MTTHLSSQEFVDALDRNLAPSRHTHLAECTSCQGQLEELRSLLDAAADGGAVPEPSPLFWDHFRSRVRAAVEAEAASAAPASWWRTLAGSRTFVAVGGSIATVALAVAVYFGRPVPPAEGPAMTADLVEVTDAPLSIDGEEWEFMASMMGSLEQNDIHEVLTPSRDAVDAAIETLSSDERDTFMRLLQAELAEGME